jgi:preprotein translocase subunit SecE
MSSIIGFFREVYAELGKIIWPTRQQAINYTLAVIVFSVAIALILGAADFGLLKGLEKALNR